MEVAVEQCGYVTTDDARSAGVSPAALRLMAHRGDAERIAHGLYRLRLVPHNPDRDQLMEATLWPRGLGVISHDSALELWDLCDVGPAKVHVTVPMSARLRREVPAVYVVHVRDLDPADVTKVDGIPVVTVKQAILGGVERYLDGRLLDQAVDAGQAIGQLSVEDVAQIARARASAD
jgi:predicted transcriptional regulator of viral defense system